MYSSRVYAQRVAVCAFRLAAVYSVARYGARAMVGPWRPRDGLLSFAKLL